MVDLHYRASQRPLLRSEALSRESAVGAVADYKRETVAPGALLDTTPESERGEVKHKVLLADDDPGLRRLVATTLGTDDFDLLHAADGEETLVVAREEHPDIILLDINMPRRNGLDVCRIVKTDPELSDIKVVMLTASGTEGDRARAFETSADDYFIKPFSPVALLNKIYALLA